MPIWGEGETVAVWGCGREGRAAQAWLRAHGVEPTMLDDAPPATPPDGEILIGEAAARALAAGRFACVVKSPGIPLRRPEIAAAKAAGVRFTSPTNLWFEEHPRAKVIAVSGTKGKSTTARLTHHLLAASGFDAKIYGNVGVPALGHPPGGDVTVLELSSYQIADLERGPALAVLTNLYPEHAPWHGGVEAYYRDKLRLADFPGTTVVANRADLRLRERLTGRDPVVWFNAETGFAADGETLRFAGKTVACDGFPLHGAHNYVDLAAACAAATAFGVKGLDTRVDLAGFVQLPHRLEEFSVNGITCVDDSLSTVPEACLAALQAYGGRRIALLLGGFDRGQDYGGLIDFLPRVDLAYVALLPDTGARVAPLLSASPPGCDWRLAADLDDAVADCLARLSPGDVLLLSPAAPSFGRFRDYEERGRRFKALCRELAQRSGRP